MEEKKFRVESDLLGELQVPEEAYYGVQTQRAINNYHISRKRMCDYPDYVVAIAYVKLAAVETNRQLGEISDEVADAMAQACRELIDGKMHENFVTDMVQGGAGTSVNMNANEVIANRACEIMGHKKGEFQYCSPNDHANCGQSTNDVYPTTIRLTLILLNKKLVASLSELIAAFRRKGEEFKHVIKMGRTQLQDAVPMTSGQEFNAFANTLEEEIANLNRNAALLHEINMGGTAIGTGLNAAPGFPKICAEKLSELTGMEFVAGADLVEATPDTGAYVSYSSALKRLAVKLSKICNDLRLLASGPRCGLNEINLPPMDLTWLPNAMDTLREKCIDGITVNKDRCLEMVKHSIGIVTALNPYIGYKNSTKIAKEALETGGSVYDLVLEHNLLSKEKLDAILSPEHMLAPEERVK